MLDFKNKNTSFKTVMNNKGYSEDKKDVSGNKFASLEKNLSEEKKE
jgi:hypothetical protein